MNPRRGRESRRWPAGGSQAGGGLWLALLLILVISGLFLALQYHQSPDSLRPVLDAVRNTGRQAVDPPAPEPVAEPARSDRIISCTTADGSTFWTNARRCEDADLDNRVTEIPAQRAAGDGSLGRNCLDPKVPHQFLPACAEAYRAALELESELAQAPDPAVAPQAEEYCALIAQGVHVGCPATSAVFCYLAVCQQRASQPTGP